MKGEKLMQDWKFLIQKEGLALDSLSKSYTYAVNSTSADYTLQNLSWTDGFVYSDVRLRTGFWPNVKFGIPGIPEFYGDNVGTAVTSAWERRQTP